MGITIDGWRSLLRVSDHKRSRRKGGYYAVCPCHDDHDPSLEVWIGSKGQTEMRCWACGADRLQVAEALGKTLADVAVDALTGEPPERGRRSGKKRDKAAADSGKRDEQAERKPPLARRPFAKGQTRTHKGATVTLTDLYDYRDAEGVLRKRKARYEGTDAEGKRVKTFLFQSVGEDGQLYDADLWHDLLYRLPELAQAKAEHRTVYVVEGEKDADNLTALGCCAVSGAYGAGVQNLERKWLPAYTQALTGCDRVVVIPDNDANGYGLQQYICEALIGRVGELLVLYLQDSLTDEEKGQFLKGDFTDWAHLMRGRGMTRGQIMALFAELTDKAMPYVRQGKADMLPAQQGGQATDKPQDGGQAGDGDGGGDDFAHYMGLREYCIEDGRLCRIQGSGKRAWAKPLCDFVPELAETVTRDDGIAQDTEWVIRGKDRHGQALPEAQVKNDEFLAMRWPARAWKTYGNIYPGSLTAGYVRDAILRGGQGRAKDRTVYGYTGFREIGSRIAYLYQGGAIGAEGVSVELSSVSPHYHLRLPEIPGREPRQIEEDGARAIAALATGFPARIILPLLAQAFLGPLYSTMTALSRTPGYVVFLVGQSGSFKSTLQGYVQSMFGDFHAKQMPANFRSTANWTSDAPYYCKDTLFTCDDFYQTRTKRESDELNRVANNLISAASDRAARNRQSADKGVIKGRPVRSTITMTGEVLPEINEGRTLRLYIIHAERGEIAKDVSELAPYARLQRGGAYRAGMHGYIKWLMTRWPELPDIVDTLLDESMEMAEGLGIDTRYARMRENAGYLIAGSRIMIRYLTDMGALDDKQAQALEAAAITGIGDNLARQTEDVRDMTPAQVYLDVIRSLIVTQAVSYVDLTDAHDKPVVDGHTDYANRPMVGWRDSAMYYLDPEAIDKAVRQNLKDRESSLGMSGTAVRRQMMAEGALIPGTERGRETPLKTKRIRERTLRLLWIPRDRIDGTETPLDIDTFKQTDEPVPF